MRRLLPVYMTTSRTKDEHLLPLGMMDHFAQSFDARQRQSL